MSYNYQTERKDIFTEEGQVLFLRVRDQVQKLLKTAGAFQIQYVFDGLANCSFTSWTVLACVDRLCELGEIREIIPRGDSGEAIHLAGQYRIFVGKNS